MLMYSWERKRVERKRGAYPQLRRRVQGVKALYSTLAAERSTSREAIAQLAYHRRLHVILGDMARRREQQRDRELDVLAQKVAVRLRHWGIA